MLHPGVTYQNIKYPLKALSNQQLSNGFFFFNLKDFRENSVVNLTGGSLYIYKLTHFLTHSFFVYFFVTLSQVQ